MARLLQLLDAQKNQLFLPFAAIFLWSFQLAVRIDSWRARSGPAIAGWLAAVGELEALCALAAYAWENPADVFPTIETTGARFEARSTWDIRCWPRTSWFATTWPWGGAAGARGERIEHVGQEHLAPLGGDQYGAAHWPDRLVCAQKLTLTPLAIGATLRVQDSLQAGRSRFYAEITRLRQLVDLSRGPIPFALPDRWDPQRDELARSKRGGESVIRGLIGRGAIGLVTTHDLALR